MESKWKHAKKGSLKTPLAAVKYPEKCSCQGCGTCDSPPEKIVIEYLYLDLQTCERCIGTDQVLEEVVKELIPALQLAGYEVEYEKIEMETEESARKHRFLSSPTIRVNGIDICQSVAENSCGCCSEISGTDVDCRVFEFEGETYEVPPAKMLARSVLQVIFGRIEHTGSVEEYKLPENLKEFFDGKKNQVNEKE